MKILLSFFVRTVTNSNIYRKENATAALEILRNTFFTDNTQMQKLHVINSDT